MFRKIKFTWRSSRRMNWWIMAIDNLFSAWHLDSLSSELFRLHEPSLLRFIKKSIFDDWEGLWVGLAWRTTFDSNWKPFHFITAGLLIDEIPIENHRSCGLFAELSREQKSRANQCEHCQMKKHATRGNWTFKLDLFFSVGNLAARKEKK